PLLTRLALERPPRASKGRDVDKLKHEAAISDMRTSFSEMEGMGEPSGIACPECHGVLWVEKENGRLHFRCRVGHGYSQKTLEAAMSESLEQALWTAVRAIEEKVSLLHQLAKNARQRKRMASMRNFERHAKELEPAACAIRDFLN